ncbi:hypothetical protein GS584_23300 [Rhodococcus hoagii]|nr:hypothetical protein [Prescottella equi]
MNDRPACRNTAGSAPSMVPASTRSRIAASETSRFAWVRWAPFGIPVVPDE